MSLPKLAYSFAAAMQTRPLLMNAATGATLCAGSDCIAQRIEQSRGGSGSDSGNALDWLRLLSSGLIGGGLRGMFYPFAYGRLDALLPGKALVAVIQKSLLELVTVGLFVNYVSIYTRGLFAGRQLKEVANHVWDVLPSVTLNDCRVWLPYNLLMFALIPTFIRPTTTALVGAGWNTYISLKSHDYLPSPELSAAF